MNMTLETVEAVYTHNTFLRNKKGISLIALVITIIVMIILAAIAFVASTGTIGRANYSKFVSNVSEVQDAIREKMISVKGTKMAAGAQITDGQVYNYIAKGGTTDSDFLTESKVPDYTVIEQNADIGIKLPKMKVNTPTKTGVEVKYAVTNNGIVFTWPPFPNEEKYYITADETVSSELATTSGEFEIVIANSSLKLLTDVDSVLQTKEMVAQGLSKSDFENLKDKIKVGGYVNYSPTSGEVNTDPTKTGYPTEEIIRTQASTEWRILSIDEDTGNVLITTQGPVNSVTLKGITSYLYSPSELHRICKALYSNDNLKLSARSMVIEDLDKASGYVALSFAGGYAWYPDGTDVNDMKDRIIDGNRYEARKHSASLENGLQKPRFYAWDNDSGERQRAINENGYNDTISKENPTLMARRWYDYDPGLNNSIINDILGSESSWLASTCESLYSGYECGDYDVRYANSGRTGAHIMYLSNGLLNVKSLGIRPVISFSISRLDVDNEASNGGKSAPWNIK